MTGYTKKREPAWDAITPLSTDVHMRSTPCCGPELLGSMTVSVPPLWESADIRWYDGGGIFVGSGVHVKDVQRGTYNVRIMVRGELVHQSSVEVGGPFVATIRAYQVHDASCETAWDGSVVAEVVYPDAVAPCPVAACPASPTGQASYKFRWSNGKTTTRPELRDVRPGSYTVSIMCDDVVIPHMHACASAAVGFRS